MNTNVTTFTLSSKDLEGQVKMKQVFNSPDCKGENISPHLCWANAPEGTRSFAVTVYDPDAPTGSGWWHWIAFNIPAHVTELPENAGDPKSGPAPEGTVQSFNDYGQYGYGGPCPPPGDGPHAYIFTVYALDVPALDLTEHINPAAAGFQIRARTIGKASLISYYER